MGMGMGMGGFTPMGGIGMSLLMLSFWGLIIVLVVWGVRALAGGSSAGTNARAALELLRERYARGEIDDREFEEKRRALSE